MASGQSSGGQSEELLAALIGSRKAVKYGKDNLLFGKDKQDNLKPMKVASHLSVVNMMKLIKTTESCPFQKEINAFLLVIKLPSASQCKWYKINKCIEKAKITMDHIQRHYGETALANTMILFTRGNNPVSDFEQSPDIQNLLKKCSGVTYTCCKRMKNHQEISELVDKIKSITQHKDNRPQEQNSMRNKEEHEEDGNLKEEKLNNKLRGDMTMQGLNNTEIIEEERTVDETKAIQACQWDGKQDESRQSENQLFSKQEYQEQSGRTSATGRVETDRTVQHSTKQEDNNMRKQEEHEEDGSLEEMQNNELNGDRTWVPALSNENAEQHKVPVVVENLSQRRASSRNTQQLHSSQDSTKEIPVDSAEELLQRFGLQNFYPNKLNMDAVLCVERSKETLQTESSVAFNYLQKLLMLNYRARFITEEKNNPDIIFPIISREDYESKKYTDNDSLFGDIEDDVNNQSNQIHPMDVQMAVFHCADSFLRQYMVTKLSSCQYALPLLVPSPTSTDIELPLWTFRQIKKTWKSVGGLSTSLPVCQIKAPMVFFCRLGSVSTSKSQLLNSVINPKHNIFFHRDSPGSSRNCLFMEGLVEIAWYCPAGNTDDLFSECLAFCNLHGDASEHIEQREFMIEQATVIIVLMQNLELDEKGKELLLKLHKSSKPLICVVSDLQKGPLKMGTKYNVKIGLKDRNNAELHKELITTIKVCLKKCDSSPTFSLMEISELTKSYKFRIDEDNEECQEGKTGALGIIKLLKGEDISQIKATFLACQGKLWQEWSRKKKQLYRLYGDVEQTKSKIQEEMKSLRKQQRESSLEFITTVCENLNSKSVTKKMYFVRWLGVYLDISFSEKLSEVTQQYYKQLSAVHLFKQKREVSDDFRKKEEELEKLSEKVDVVTLGLEHIVREMGQIYEAWAETPDRMTAEVSILPVLAADLLISGHPLELMDGDAAHVPLTWIESVLDKVTESLGDQRVFVLSVLGLQSSGKSTMLNAMFGLQFAVSAGRCTRGAFMQLIRVKEEVKDQLKFDYLLVVDTEGLQALELAGKSRMNHDNELATFIIGLGNMTLINVFGENPAEIQEVLQVAVEAILRMNKVRLNPSCMFVHQNVTDITAAEKNMEGSRRLLEKLDEVAVSVAKTEGYDLKCFSDVIKFNIQTDVHYFAQLWEGNPPMAPPNPRYSENIENLKQAILKAAAGKNCLKLSELKVRIKDLWSAVLNEDFVFSFKNTLEISVYRRLEVMYGNWTWSLRKASLVIENKLRNRIENAKQLSISHRMIHEEINVTFSNILREMEKFFTKDKDTKILSQWKERTEKKIQELTNSLAEETKMRLDRAVQQKKKGTKLDELKSQYEEELLNKSKDLASTLKDKAMNELDFKREFDSMWGKWLSDLRVETPPTKDVNVEQEVMNILSSYFERRTIYSNTDTGHYTEIYNRRDYSDYVTVKKGMFGISYYSLDTKDHDSVRKLVQQTVREAEEIIRTKPVDKTGYSDAYTQEIVNCVKKRVAEFKAEKFTLKNEFTVDLSLYICSIAVRRFTDLHKVFRDANDPVIYLENKKGEFFSIFKKQCEGATATAVFADFVCNKLKPSILQSVYDQTAIDAAGEMRANFPAFNGNRSNLEKHILLDLAEAESFDRFITYIEDPKKHFSDFIETKFKEQILEGRNPRILDILRNAANMKQFSVSTAIQKATEETKQNKGDVNEWLKIFSLELQVEIKFVLQDLKGAYYQEITDIDFFHNMINKALQSVFNETTSCFDNISSVRMNVFSQRPEDILKNQLCGCWVQCPFCAAICTNTIEGHEGKHSVPFHRPGGVSGRSWHKTDNLTIDICTSLVASDAKIVLPDGKRIHYKKFRNSNYACWGITPDTSEQAYWKWFVCRFQEDLEKYYGKTFEGKGEIPKVWRNITNQTAKESLKNRI
ncbi:interferon-induced very large GTPase 1-like [Pygocentrus nattereri]|uniref:VLIG-type G domain-containing protein n=1 Tax=Pygocentrus nattereri TaxID=42514 RepID=A0A3B4CFI9_PYGNA|nr:interferon-induced very large GTPase 1-like [Pygocentrus nattereri]XP_017539080.1 interferon-induced very large GTPase 1-like [Pygocentrus nattereri]